MLKVFEYELEPAPENLLTLPQGARILSVEEQYGKMVLYALVNPQEEKKETFRIIISGTGHELDNSVKNMPFIGTVKLMSGNLMFHVFAERK